MFEFKLFSKKQIDVIKNADAFINILEGSVRSGKTIASIVAWMNYLYDSPHEIFLMSGESTDSLYRNVITPMVDMLGERSAKYLGGTKGGASFVINLKGRKKICYCRGASKSNDEGKIRGMTIGGWYADEIVLHHRDFVNQAITRLSKEGAKAIWTTNPDNPFHYIKKEFIDRVDTNNYKHWHFDLDDNLSLDERYKENIKKNHTGLWYDRFINGLWVLADGVIYPMFNQENITETANKKYSEFYISCDYGIQNPMVFLLWGKHNKKWYCIKEYYHVGQGINNQKTDEEYYEDLVKFSQGYDVKGVVIDPSATSFITLIRKKNKFIAIKAKNAVNDGIQNTSTLLRNRELLFDYSCENCKKEFSTYVWDEDSALKGKDQPLKQNDHYMDAIRYMAHTIICRNGIRFI